MMNVIPIDDPADPRLTHYRNLRHADVHKRGPRFIAEGRMVTRRLLASDYPIESVLAEENRLADVAELDGTLTPVYLVKPDVIREVAGFAFHRGLLSCGKRLAFSRDVELASIAVEQARVLALISISDADNLGSLLRTAAAFGITNIALNRQTIDPLSRRALRVSMGAALRMRYFDLAQPEAWFADNASRGNWQTVATTLSPDCIPIDQFQRGEQPVMIVMGNEADGLPASIQRTCAARVNIPMAPGVDSLNVAVAGAIMLYELTRPAGMTRSERR